MLRDRLFFLHGGLRIFQWILLCNYRRHWNSVVHDWVVLPKFKQLFVRGYAKNDMFGAR